MHAFEKALSVATEEIEFWFRGVGKLVWENYELNPRRLRGSDFLMRWSQGVWSEGRLVEAVEKTEKYFALPYGPSGTAPDSDVRELEIYFERLERAGLGKLKRPDLLIFKVADRKTVERLVRDVGGAGELPFTPERDARLQELLATAIIAVECENSLWRAKQMRDYNHPLRPQRRLGGKPGLRKGAVLPTVILKEEDREPLRSWQTSHELPVHIWHVFFDLAFGLTFKDAERLIKDGLIEPTPQVFQAPGGATTRKDIFKFYHHYAYSLAESLVEPTLVADSITDQNGHILPYVRFQGGSWRLAQEALGRLDEAAASRRKSR